MTAVRRWLVLGYGLQRWEVLAVIVGSGVAVGAMLWLHWQLTATVLANPGCADVDAPSVAAGCQEFIQHVGELTDWGSQLLRASWAAPFGMGVILGVPLVSREVEHRTAALAWTLGRSRTTWLVGRVAFVLLLSVLLLAMIGLASDWLAAAMAPHRQLSADFTWYGRRGAVLLARGLLALGIGVAAGAFIGRTLPALLVAAVASALLFTGLSLGMDRWNAQEAVTARFGTIDPAALSVGQRVSLSNGELVGGEYLAAFTNIAVDNDGAVYSQFDPQTGMPDRSSLVGYQRELILPGERYREVVARESGAAGGLALVALGLSAAVVRRRRPGA